MFGFLCDNAHNDVHQWNADFDQASRCYSRSHFAERPRNKSDYENEFALGIRICIDAGSGEITAAFFHSEDFGRGSRYSPPSEWKILDIHSLFEMVAGNQEVSDVNISMRALSLIKTLRAQVASLASWLDDSLSD